MHVSVLDLIFHASCEPQRSGDRFSYSTVPLTVATGLFQSIDDVVRPHASAQDFIFRAPCCH
jgi:hypothetical protein